MADFLTVNDLATQFRVSRATIYRLMGSGMPSVKIGGSRRFDIDAVVTWLHTEADPVTEAVLLAPGDYKCTACEWPGRLTRAFLRSGLRCPNCGTKGQVEPA